MAHLARVTFLTPRRWSKPLGALANDAGGRFGRRSANEGTMLCRREVVPVLLFATFELAVLVLGSAGIQAQETTQRSQCGTFTTVPAKTTLEQRRCRRPAAENASNPWNAYPDYWGPFPVVGEGRAR
jgi:hypothetical protein